MASTIQQIETPKRARALDASSGWQAVSAELFTTADGTSIVNEANGHAAWTAMAGSSAATKAVVSSGEYHGDYAVKYTPAGGEGNGDGIRMDLNTYCTVGKTYEIRIWGKHANDGTTDNLHYIRLSGVPDLGAATASTVNLANPQTGREPFQEGESADIAWSERFIRFTHSADTRYFGARESGTSNDGSLILDSLSIKEVRYFPNNNHGQIYSGRGLEFDGVTDHLTGPTDINTSHGITNTITVACWIKTSSFSATQNPWNFFEDTNDGWGLEIKTDGKICFRDDIDGDLPGQADTMTYENLIQLNTWYRVVGVLDNLEQKLYINGTLVGSGTNVNDGLDSFNSALFIGKRGNSTHYFNGAMTDFQIWDTAWSADDVIYDYLNPESLALNRGGTLLTESNLKIWYPMQDGHRGQQSYIPDASNTRVGDETITNGSFTGITQAVDTTGSEWTTRAGWTISEGKAHRDGSGGSNSDIEQSISVVNGTTYKFSYTRTYASGAGQTNVYIRTNNVDYVTVGSYTSTTVEEHTVTGYFTALFTGSMPFRVFGIGTWTGTFDNISVKPVNDKNNATTVFYGDNLYTAANALKVAADGTTADDTDATTGWSTAATSSHTTSSTVHTGNKSMTYTANANNGRVYTDLQSYMTVGRTYKLSIFARHVGSGADQYLRFSSATDMTSDAINLTNGVFTSSDTTFEEAHLTFVYDDSNYRYFGAREIDGDAGTGSGGLFMDTMYIKEVGVASGWTDADQQLHIPQIALQSYNELAWMNGFDDGTDSDISCGSDTSIDNIFDGGGTISAWIFPNGIGAGSHGRIIDKHQWKLFLSSATSTSCVLEFNCTNATTTTDTTSTNRVINFGKWQHIVVTYNSDGTDPDKAVIYLNGEEIGTTESGAGAGARNDDSSEDLIIGNNKDGDRTFEGCITGVTMHSTAINASKVRELYNDGKELDATTFSGVSAIEGYWRNNGLNTWTDLSSNSNNGTVNNITETMLIPQGLDNRDSQGFIMNRQRNTSSLNFINKADLGAANDRVEVGPFTDLIADGATTASVECWVKANGTAGSDDYCTFAGERSSKNIMLCGRTSTNRPAAVYALTTDGNNNQLEESSINVFDGDWHHMVFTFQSDDRKGRLYVDGSLHDTTTAPTAGDTLANDAALFYVGGSDAAQDRNFNGMVDGVRVYSDALSAGEVKRNYDATKGSHRN